MWWVRRGGRRNALSSAQGRLVPAMMIRRPSCFSKPSIWDSSSGTTRFMTVEWPPRLQPRASNSSKKTMALPESRAAWNSALRRRSASPKYLPTMSEQRTWKKSASVSVAMQRASMVLPVPGRP